MLPDTFINHMIQGALSSSLGTGAAIILGTFILEDATTVAVGVMAADGLIPIPLALLSLATGIALGDFGLYGIGRFAITHPRLQGWVHSKKLRPLGNWLNTKLYSTVVAARFLPGARLPTYLACGFFSVPFSRFAVPVIGATAVWSTLLFACSYYFGVYTLTLLGVWRWPIAISAAVFLAYISRKRWSQAMKDSHD
jgi:membrane protein DedA with SNARE-associated domain